MNGIGDGLLLLMDVSSEFNELPLISTASVGAGADAVYRRTDQISTDLLDAATAFVGVQDGLVSREYATTAWHQAVDRLTALERYCDRVGVSLTSVSTQPAGDDTFVVLSQRWRHGYRSDVLKVQQRLNTLGYGWVDPDGRYGPLTEAAVETFQQAQGLRSDGVVGPRTWQVLFGSAGADEPQSGGPGNDGLIVGSDTRGAGSAPAPVPMPWPSAICADGTSSYSAHRSGTCSWHGGVASWSN